MKYLLILISLWLVTPCLSQDQSVIAYHYKAKHDNGIILLKCNVGYYYSGPHIFVDEIFSYEIDNDKIIRTFDPKYSLYGQVDTLRIGKNAVHAQNGQSFKKLSPRKRDRLIKDYILPEEEIGNYQIFLNRTSSCKG
ncbi:MAG: hypothetical protein WBB27_08425 [Maribacter sp.]